MFEAWRKRPYPFRLDALLDVMHDFAMEAYRCYRVDPLCAVLPMLAVAGAAIGNSLRLEIHEPHPVPAVIWSANLSSHEPRNLAVLRLVLHPLQSNQELFAEEYDVKMLNYDDSMEEWENSGPRDRGPRPQGRIRSFRFSI